MNKSVKSTSKFKYLKIIIPIVVIAALPVLLAVVVGRNVESEEPMRDVSINTVFSPTIEDNPELAAASGVRGLVEIGYAGSPESESTLVATRGQRVTIPIFISFTSYDPDLKSLDILIDPSREDIGVQRWQCWYEYDSKGNEINKGEICINNLISYDREGTVTMEAGDRVEFNMFIDIPSDLPPLETKSVMLIGAGIGLERAERGVGLSDNLGGKEIKLNE